jgi:hypothetical protein
MDPATGWCRGCLRTIDEIVAWGGLDDEGKRRVWALLPARRASLAPPPEALARTTSLPRHGPG